MKDNKKDALDYHEFPQPGKIAVVPTKKHASQYDLSLAYSPGVAEPCLAIEANKNDAYRYMNKGKDEWQEEHRQNLLANGSLGLLFIC